MAVSWMLLPTMDSAKSGGSVTQEMFLAQKSRAHLEYLFRVASMRSIWSCGNSRCDQGVKECLVLLL